MHAPATRAAAVLAASAALVLGANALTTSSTAAPGAKTATVTDVSARAGNAVYRVRPFGTSLTPGGEYYTVKVPRTGNYEVTLRGFTNYTASPASLQCFVVDKQKILANDLSGYYVVAFSDSETSYDFGMNESIDVDLKKTRPLLVGCGASGDVEILKPITATFERNGDFKNLDAKPFTPPVRMGGQPLGGLGG